MVVSFLPLLCESLVLNFLKFRPGLQHLLFVDRPHSWVALIPFLSAWLLTLGSAPRPRPRPGPRPRPVLPPGRAPDTGSKLDPAPPTSRASATSWVLSPGPGVLFPGPDTAQTFLQAEPPASSWLTCQGRGEAEGVVAVPAAVAGPVAADAWPPVAAAWSPRVEHRVAHGALEQPTGVAPVQPLGPRWRRRGWRGQESPAQARL